MVDGTDIDCDHRQPALLWLTDRFNPRVLLGLYYVGRGCGLAVLPFLLHASVQPLMIIFIVVYSLDWVATVPPTVALSNEAFGTLGPIVFGWVLASHQIGAAIAAFAAGAHGPNRGMPSNILGSPCQCRNDYCCTRRPTRWARTPPLDSLGQGSSLVRYVPPMGFEPILWRV